MSLLSCQNLCISFAQRDIIKNASFEIAKGDKIGLIGANGCGKTSLLNALSGKAEISGGKIVKAADTEIGSVEQHACADSKLTVFDELLSIFNFLFELENELDVLHRKIELTQGKVPEYIERQAELTEKYQRLGGLTYKNRVHSCLMGLGFSAEDENMPVSVLSGGEKTKLALGKLLLSRPDIMLLDEPTNHLDIKSVEWLEDFIEKLDNTVLIVSHDRYFLDRTTSKTFEISNKKLCSGRGCYSEYMKNKALMLETQRREYDKAAAEIKRLEQMIEQQRRFNRERNYITIASKEKQIERLKAAMPELPPAEKTVKLRFSDVKRSGDEVLIAEQLKKQYGEKILFDKVNIKLMRGEKIFLLGPNGCGKSTLLKMLINKIPKDTGFSRIGHNVTVGYFEQTHSGLMSKKTVIEELSDIFPLKGISELRGYLGAFNFKNDDIEKKMDELSGGERARIALLELILKKPNFLILDEPTNHLDFSSREVLEEALAEYEGTVLCVSHDRYFVNRLADGILFFDGEAVKSYKGNYDDYVACCAEKKREKTVDEPKKINGYKLRKENESRERKRKTRLDRLGTIISEALSEQKELNSYLEQPDIAADYEKLLNTTKRLEELSRIIDEAETEWLELSE